MTDLKAFLSRHGWGDAKIVPLAGDASSRSYLRVHRGDDTAIAMLDPTGTDDRFAAVDTYLRSHGFSAPEILAHEPGRMLLEDLGDAVFAREIARAPDLEAPLMQRAARLLAHLHNCAPMAGLAPVPPSQLAELVYPVFEHYLPLAGIAKAPDQTAILAELETILIRAAPETDVTVLRDFHAENMIWLAGRDGIAQVGLVDFQDAWIGHRAYDLVSLVQDARRDVSRQAAQHAIRLYLDRSGQSETGFAAAFHALGLQRNLRILGVFARLASDMRKPRYLSLMPRVWSHIRTSLETPVAARLKPLILDSFPEVTSELVSDMRSRCPVQ